MKNKNLDSQQLIDYYFGTIDDNNRNAVEELLTNNPVVLNEYLTLKRELEIDNSSEFVPAKSLKAQLDKELFLENQMNWQQVVSQFFTFPKLVTATVVVALLTVFSIQLTKTNNDQRDSAQISGVILDTSSLVSANIDVL